MAWTESQNFAITRTELDEVFFQNFNYENTSPSVATARTAEIFKPLQTTHSAYIEEIYKGSPLFPIIGEINPVPQSTPAVANKMTTAVKDFAQGIRISKDLFDDNLHGVWSFTVSDFARKARVTQDQHAFGIFRGAFTTTLTADGQPLCGTHPLIGGGTTTNFISGVASALSSTSLNTLTVLLRQQPDQAGVILGDTPKYLLVPSKLVKTAIEETQSALSSDSANNAVNVWRSAYDLTIYSSPYMDAVAGGSDTAWFLLGRNHRVTRLIRQGIQTALTDWSYSTDRTYFYQANFREEVYCPDYVNVVGSVGV